MLQYLPHESARHRTRWIICRAVTFNRKIYVQFLDLDGQWSKHIGEAFQFPSRRAAEERRGRLDYRTYIDELILWK